MALVKTTAIVLKSRKWGEADRIVTFYTRQLGKIRGVARGARRQKSRFGSTLEPFTLCHLDLFERPGDSLFRISHVDAVQSFQPLREDLALMASAARMVNVVAAVTPDGDPDSRLFDTLEEGLESLKSDRDPAYRALLFQIRFLGLTGFRPQTDHCAACGKTRLSADPQFSPTAGGLVCAICAGHHSAHCIGLSRGSLMFLQQALRLTPAIVTRLRATGQIRTEVEEAIDNYVAVVAGKKLPPADFLAPAVSV